MLNIDSPLIENFLDENQDFFTNAKVQKIQQPTRRELVLHLRNNGESKKLYINIHPEFCHLCFMSRENESKRSLKIPQKPPMFCMLLRKHMEGAKILRASKPEYERIIELCFENYNEIGDRIEECLSIELMGKHSNIVLYNADTNIILGCAHNIGAQKSKERELAGSLPYVYPPKQKKKDLLKTKSMTFFKILEKTEEPLKTGLAKNFFNLSQIMSEEICEQAGINPYCPANELCQEEKQKLYIALFETLSKKNVPYSISKDFDKFSSIKDYPNKYADINSLIDDYYAFHLQKFLLQTAKANLKDTVQKTLKKLNNSLKNREKLLENEEKAAKYKLKADLIMANLYTITAGNPKIEVFDFEGKEKIEIELDENITLIDNTNKYYTKYNKAKKAFAVALEFLKEIKKEIAYYEEILFFIEISSDIDEIAEIRSEIAPPNKIEKVNSKKKENTSSIERREINGFSVYIGKNNKQNDYIFSKISAPSDLWFHALNVPGAHLLIKIPNEKSFPDSETLLKTAQLAKLCSAAKDSGKTPVIYTQRKYIKKPPNQKGGMVTYRNETEIIVE